MNTENRLLYAYDELGTTTSIGYNNTTAYGLVKFTADTNQFLTGLGTYSLSSGTVIDFEVYTTKSGDDLDNMVAVSKGIVCDYPGYYKVDLEKEIPIAKNEDFYIKVKYDAPENTYPLPVEVELEEVAYPEIEENCCWISPDGKGWHKTGADVSGDEMDLCIKAYSVIRQEDTAAYDPGFSVFPNPA